MTATDTPLLLGSARLPAGFSTWVEALDQLGPARLAASWTGPFAAAVPLPDGRVFLAVDRFATHSLCWRLDGQTLRYAQRADALGARDIDPQAICDYLYAHCIASPRTIFRDVRRLPAGHYALFERGQLSVAPWWQVVFAAGPARYEDLRAEFRGLLVDAVTSQLDGSAPACYLSGGTDSSTVAGHIRQIAGSVSTYSIGFDAEGYDEMAYARIAAKHFGARHREYYVTPDDLVRSIADVAVSFDQPFGNSSAVPSYYCALRARDDGVSKILAGDGGDELFGGNSRYALQRLYNLYGGLPALLRRGLLEPVFGLPAVARMPLLRKGSSYIRDARVPLPDRLQHYNLLRRLGPDEVMTAAFRAAVSLEAPLLQQRQVWAMPQADNDVDRMLAFDWRYTLAESDLPKVLGATGLAGLDVGFPLIDDRLVDFSLRLPASYKLRGFKLRWFFKEALRDLLPQEIITKKKKGFGLPFGVWANRHAALGALAAESLRGIATRGIVRPEFVRDLLEQHLPAHPGYYGEMVWILMMLEQWLRRHAPDYRFEATRA